MLEATSLRIQNNSFGIPITIQLEPEVRSSCLEVQHSILLFQLVTVEGGNLGRGTSQAAEGYQLEEVNILCEAC